MNSHNGFDSKYDYTRFLLIAILSFTGAVVWLFIDSKIKYYYTAKLKVIIQKLLRYYVGFTLIISGFSKVLLLQFGLMNISSLETKMGNLTVMSFLWKIMNYSEFYAIVTGFIEVIGGILVLFICSTYFWSFMYTAIQMYFRLVTWAWVKSESCYYNLLQKLLPTVSFTMLMKSNLWDSQVLIFKIGEDPVNNFYATM